MKKAIYSENAPAPIGPYSQGIRTGDTLYISGQIAFVPQTGQLTLDTIESETHQVMKNIGAILDAAGLDYHHIISTTIFLKDM
ncbi:MAG TPA: Rid family hydrolase, partial [Saprospiraceae bacterium]|nr:Rid family hydrolase [Saprospiraceae bacterium]